MKTKMMAMMIGFGTLGLAVQDARAVPGEINVPVVETPRLMGEREGGVSTRGGGRAIQIANRPRLRDLVEKSVCKWTRADKLFDSLTHSKKMMSSLEETHWYFADVLRRELKDLKVCRTRKLVQIPLDERNDLTIMYYDRSRQLAIRIWDRIYLDMDLFGALPTKTLDREATMVHETLHSFIPFGIDERDDKVMSMNNAIAINTTNRLDLEDFAIHIEMNEVQITPYSSILDPIRTPLLKALDRTIKKSERMRAAAEIFPSLVWENLVERDRYEILDLLHATGAAAVKNVCDGKSKGILKDFGLDPSARIFTGPTSDALAEALSRNKCCEERQFSEIINASDDLITQETGYSLIDVVVSADRVRDLADLLPLSKLSLTESALKEILSKAQTERSYASLLDEVVRLGLDVNVEGLGTIIAQGGNATLIEKVLSSPETGLAIKKEIVVGILRAPTAATEAVLKSAILKGNIDPDLWIAKWETAIQLAWKSQSEAILEALVKVGANTNVVDRNGYTPLMLAARELGEWSKTGASILLQSKNIDVMKLGPKVRGESRRKTALEMAMEHDQLAVARLLIQDPRQVFPAEYMTASEYQTRWHFLMILVKAGNEKHVATMLHSYRFHKSDLLTAKIAAQKDGYSKIVKLIEERL